MAYAAIIIGSGQAGGPLAMAFANAGKKTALIEEIHIGGTCVNEGCTPTKTMVASARVAYLAGRGKDYGVDLQTHFQLNMNAVRKRKRELVDSFRGGSESRIKNTENLDFFDGTAKFVGPKKLEITNSGNRENVQTITGETVFINAGCHPTPLSIPGADKVDILNSTTIMELGEVPSHLIVIGGGYVGLEFAQMFRRFGSKVTVIQRGTQLLGREDEDIAKAVKKILVEDGLEIILNMSPLLVSKSSTGEVEIKVALSGSCMNIIRGSHVLSAAGRTPATHSLGLEAAGIEVDEHSFIKVNDKLETNIPGVYALGDVKGGPQFTHVSYDDFRIIKHNLLTSPNTSPKTTTDRLVPYTVFMDPQLGRIGLTETEARKIYPADKIKVAKMPMAYVARALEMDESRGVMKAIVHADTKQILGAAILGIEGGEIMSMLQIAMMGGVAYDKLQDAVFAHPCLAESLNNLWGFLE